MKNAKEKMQALRALMQAENIKACIIPSTDPHVSEYPPAHWKTREWLSGFTGSAGTVAVTLEKAGLWTDSRYFLQAEKQLENSGIELFKAGLPETPDMLDRIASELLPGDCVGIEGAVFAASEAQSLVKYFAGKGLKIRTDFAPCSQLWDNRPALPESPAFILPERFSGKSCREKIKSVTEILKKNKADATILAALDSIAWLFNIRGNDVAYNPVCMSYAVVSERETVLFIPSEKVTEEVADYLYAQGVVIADYTKITDYIRSFAHRPSPFAVLTAPSRINYGLYSAIPENCVKIETPVHPVDALKSIKNETEIAGIRNAMRKDGVAMVKFLMNLEKTLASGEKISESAIAEKLRQYRSEQEFYAGESFATIAAYGRHGAIVHYEACAESDAEIRPEGVLLIDSGAQYFDGTTDLTRTLAVGAVSDDMKKDYTAVLKGLIALTTASFPKGTVGMQLDVLARQFLWQNGTNYLHGTGHGVGHFLNVHEGPQSIRMNYNPASIESGMVTSCEPGIYRNGKYGVRIENLLLVTPCQYTNFGEFYTFETLTLCPIDLKLIDFSLMTRFETDWLNRYHQKVYDTLSPFLSEEEKAWITASFLLLEIYE
ncbi:MAG: aminopeptidase P family protein [Dysgonamonadaceae bacterium]|jgi:Xaa-Pro aminopeptidase|nr:aminopeptidase P family protein [Dysgonamonadaceae bacterium]